MLVLRQKMFITQRYYKQIKRGVKKANAAAKGIAKVNTIAQAGRDVKDSIFGKKLKRKTSDKVKSAGKKAKDKLIDVSKGTLKSEGLTSELVDQSFEGAQAVSGGIRGLISGIKNKKGVKGTVKDIGESSMKNTTTGKILSVMKERSGIPEARREFKRLNAPGVSERLDSIYGAGTTNKRKRRAVFKAGIKTGEMIGDFTSTGAKVSAIADLAARKINTTGKEKLARVMRYERHPAQLVGDNLSVLRAGVLTSLPQGAQDVLQFKHAAENVGTAIAATGAGHGALAASVASGVGKTASKTIESASIMGNWKGSALTPGIQGNEYACVGKDISHYLNKLDKAAGKTRGKGYRPLINSDTKLKIGKRTVDLGKYSLERKDVQNRMVRQYDRTKEAIIAPIREGYNEAMYQAGRGYGKAKYIVSRIKQPVRQAPQPVLNVI